MLKREFHTTLILRSGIMITVKMKNLPTITAFKTKVKKWMSENCLCRLCKSHVNCVGFLRNNSKIDISAFCCFIFIWFILSCSALKRSAYLLVSANNNYYFIQYTCFHLDLMCIRKNYGNLKKWVDYVKIGFRDRF